jgi:hypothetical protein
MPVLRHPTFAIGQSVLLHITKTSAGKIVTVKKQKYIPQDVGFSIFFGKKDESLFGKNSVITKKNSGYFLNLPVPFRNFLLFPSNYRIFWKGFPNFSGFQFLSYSVQIWEIKHNNIGL